ncbi:hypothetical protein C8Q80DRAFT_1283236 [Daedaleopsis nitida]|nr:hypothetical protein C8Q80DRAFT_1283236 [Daedaleopsis nitida]
MSPKIWLITGASTGLCRNLTEIILEKGDIAVATARRPDTLSDLSSKYPSDRLLVLKLDVTVPQDIPRTFAAIKEKFGRLDVVFNNAGTTLVNNVDAHLAQEAVNFMQEVNPSGVGGRINLQHSSVAGIEGASTLDGLSEAFAVELDPAWNIKISIVSSGPFDTRIFTKGHWPPSHPAYDAPTARLAGLKRFYGSFVPTGDPRKGMEAVYKLASLEDPPLHFPLTKTSSEGYKAKAAPRGGREVRVVVRELG